MSSQTDIANLALLILGKPAIQNLFTDPSQRAVTLASAYDQIRRRCLEGPPVWRFSVKRASLPALTAVPVSGPFRTTFQLPSDYIRALQIGDFWVGLDLTDYRLGPTDIDYQIEGNVILCDTGSPLSLQYVYDVQDTTLFDPHFGTYFAAELAWWTCEAITNSLERQSFAEKRKEKALSDGAAANSMVRAPEHTADDTWIAARIQ